MTASGQETAAWVWIVVPLRTGGFEVESDDELQIYDEDESEVEA
jgi:hypothetical protein